MNVMKPYPINDPQRTISLILPLSSNSLLSCYMKWNPRLLITYNGIKRYTGQAYNNRRGKTGKFK